MQPKVEKNFEERVQEYVKPLRGKRVDPQSRPAELSSARGPGRCGSGSLVTRPRRFAGLRRVHFPRAERHDRSRGGYKPPGKVGVSAIARAVTAPVRQPPAGPRNDRVGLRGYPAIRGSSTGGDWATVPADRSPATARASRGLALRVGGEYVGLPPDPTRLETRTKESNMCASQRVLRNPRAK